LIASYKGKITAKAIGINHGRKSILLDKKGKQENMHKKKAG